MSHLVINSHFPMYKINSSLLHAQDAHDAQEARGLPRQARDQAVRHPQGLGEAGWVFFIFKICIYVFACLTKKHKKQAASTRGQTRP